MSRSKPTTCRSQVTAITHKKKPVFTQIISQVTPSESSVIKKVAYEPLFLAHLKQQISASRASAASSCTSG